MKKERMFLVLVLGFLLLLSLVSLISAAIVTKGNMNSSIETNYGPGENLRGWINITLSPIAFDAPVTAFNSSVTIGSLLDSAGIKYNCSNKDCGMDYAISTDDAHSFTLDPSETKIIGIRLIENIVSSVDAFKLNITSNSIESCTGALDVDVTNQNLYTWKSDKIGATYCGNENYGCYNPAQGSLMATDMDVNKVYCQKIQVNPGKTFKIGADVSGTGNAKFKLIVEGNYCEVITSASGKVFCDLNLSIVEPTEITACVQQDSSTSSAKYKLSVETNAPCGYVDDTDADFSIFAQQKKYAPLGTFIIDSSDYATAIYDYISIKYEGDCSLGCYIPVKLTSNADSAQTITINDLNVGYNSGLKNNNTFFVLTSSPAKISLTKFTKIDLSKAGFKVPTTIGLQTLNLKISGADIITGKKITILSLPVIEAIYPSDVPAGADVKFTLAVSGVNLTSFRWDFGDNTTAVETTKPYITHKYASAELKSYAIKITARNNLGSTNKTFTIKTVSPGDYLVNLIADYKARIVSLKKQIASFPAPVKIAIEAKINLSASEIKVQQVQSDYNNSAGSTAKYIALLNQLYSMNLPNIINITKKSSGKFVMDSSIVKSADLAVVTSSEVTATDASAQNAVFAWFLKSLDIDSETSVYSSIEGNVTMPFFTYAKITIKPLSTISSNVYGALALPQSGISYTSVSNPSYKTNLMSFPVDLSSGVKSFEFIVSDDTYILALPIYFTPVISELKFSSRFGDCNHNGKCESGETTANCGDDCKPTGRITFFFVLLIILFLAAYIGLQEWYKKKYEAWLFKDKNDLFNLVSFIENAEKQGLKKDEIFNKLREKKWAFEQVSYAYKKFKGMRTGMFEIPIFSLLEKAKLLKTIDLKKKIGTEQKIAPEPRGIFRPGMPGRPSVIPFMNSSASPVNNSVNNPVNSSQKTI
ncbi:MAG: PKD domain-containing protein [Nanoarchaeota archaeon]